jgi:hypothetical protein
MKDTHSLVLKSYFETQATKQTITSRGQELTVAAFLTTKSAK